MAKNKTGSDTKLTVVDGGQDNDQIAEAVAATVETASHSTTFVNVQNDPHFVVPEHTKAFLRAVARIAKNRPVNVALRGPKGAGKTQLAFWFAKVTGRPLCVVDVPTLREPKDLLGFKDVVKDPVSGSLMLKWKESAFVRAIQTPNAVVLLDEGTRVHASVLNVLLPLMDDRRQVYLDDLGETIRVAPGVVFFITANIGMQYTGTWQWDAALEDRLNYQIDIGYLDRETEAQVLVNKTGVDDKVAQRLAEVAEIIRRRVSDQSEPLPHEVSTRQLLAAAELIVEGVTPLDAMEFTIIPTYSPDGGEQSDRASVLAILQGKLGGAMAA